MIQQIKCTEEIWNKIKNHTKRDWFAPLTDGLTNGVVEFVSIKGKNKNVSACLMYDCNVCNPNYGGKDDIDYKDKHCKNGYVEFVSKNK